MATHDRQSGPAPSVSEPDLGFKAGFGFYLGVIIAGATAIAGVATDATTATILATAPSTLTAVLLLVFIFGHRLRGLPERIGQSRRRRLACYLPAAAFVAVLFVPAITSLESTTRLSVLAIASSLLSGAVAVGIARMTRNRSVAAVTPDEPVVSWAWHDPRYGANGWASIVMAVGLVIAGLGSIAAGNWIGLLWAGYGTVVLLANRFDWGGDWVDFDASERWSVPEIHAHAAGVVLERTYKRTLVPWDSITGIELTDDELVLEHRWLDIRCDRSAIDDPEHVLEELERARGRREPSPDARVTLTDNTK
ncbi:hypothetical protein [Natronorubrum thiooxidans]|uniref:PH domain-containing protein n=1 Tax=Natronorubrum thiooxidans TaxID=308853 RepID=A0A1N7DQF8_9EURY|nr:hypothetical protein [Natronorubrum thiooxidans]SIR77925.1 hypothetical protein SAMN05421752_102427 [Natronorubrum thiooxidans]